MHTEFRLKKTKLCLLLGLCLLAFVMGFAVNMLRSTERSVIFIKSDVTEYADKGGSSVEQSINEDDSLQRKLPTEESATIPIKKFMEKVVYNRVGKCGSRSMLTLITQLSKKNNYVFYSSPVSNRTRVPMLELIDEVRTIYELPFPSLYSRHIHYVDFAKFGVTAPIYINMIRDPIERFSSQYYFSRYGDYNKAESRRAEPWKEGEKDMDVNDCILQNHPMCSTKKLFYVVPYFCGQDYMCQRPSQQSLYQAKMHVMEHYLIVGYLEDFTGMLKVLEKVLPKYFTGALKVWTSLSANAIHHTSTLKKGSINETARALLKSKMTEEYDFYNFVKLRFKILKRQIGIPDDDKL